MTFVDRFWFDDIFLRTSAEGDPFTLATLFIYELLIDQCIFKPTLRTAISLYLPVVTAEGQHLGGRCCLDQHFFQKETSTDRQKVMSKSESPSQEDTYSTKGN